MKYPKISIITPSYNQGRFLDYAIKSVLDQKYPKVEHIIIDGNSGDDSLYVIKKYENQLTHWVSEKDRGQTHAINKGLKLSTGDIWAYLNSDDVYLAGTFEKIINYFEKNPETEIVYGNYIIINENNEVLKRKKDIDFDYNLACLIGFGIMIPQPSTFLRKSVIEKVGNFSEELKFTMDAEYWFRCAQRGIKIAHIPSYLSCFRWHVSSKTKSTKKNVVQEREKERHYLNKSAYNTLQISKLIPFEYSKLIRITYRFKRIFLKFFQGCYFK